jgi:hypothetical protein
MPIQLSAPKKKDFTLVESDKALENTGDAAVATVITVRQATQGDVEQRNTLFADFTREYDGRMVKVTQKISYDDIRRLEVFLTLCACNIINEKGDPLFKFVNERLTDKNAFDRAWAALPPVVAIEIGDKVLEMNPLWVPTSGEGL